MPNPLFSLQKVTSKTPPEYQNPAGRGGVGPYGDDEPVMETVHGQRAGNAYRGLETHGVEPNTQPVHGDAYNPGDGRPVPIEELPESELIEPIPVRLVQGASARQERRWRTFREALVAGTVGQSVRRLVSARIASEPDANRRLNLRVRNMDASAVLYIGPDESVSSANGWPVAPGATEEFLYAETEVWGALDPVVAAGTVVNVAIRTEYMVEISSSSEHKIDAKH
jgi:hypothetical protein